MSLYDNEWGADLDQSEPEVWTGTPAGVGMKKSGCISSLSPSSCKTATDASTQCVAAYWITLKQECTDLTAL